MHRRVGSYRGLVIFAVACCLLAPGRLTAAGISPRPARGKLLVASRDLADPNFEQTVLLLLDYSSEGALGVIVNRPTRMKLSLLLPDAEGIGDRPDVVHEGGPVMPGGVLALLRSDAEVEDGQHIFEDVHATASRELLERLIARGHPVDRLRVFAGYAGWGAGQLDAEVARNDWLILPGDVEAVFDASPSEVWPRLIRRQSDLVASLGLEVKIPSLGLTNPSR